MTTIQGNRPIAPMPTPDPTGAAAGTGNAGNTQAPGGVYGSQQPTPVDATPSPEKAGLPPTTTKAPQIPGPDLSGVDLQIQLQAVQEKFKENKSKSAENQLEGAKGLREKQSAQRLEVLNNAAANVQADVVRAVFDYVLKNPQQLLALATTLVPAIAAAPATGGASLLAAAPALAGIAASMATGVAAEMGVDLNTLGASIASSVLVSLGMDQVTADRIAGTSTAALALGIEIGIAVATGGTVLPKAGTIGNLAREIGDAMGMSIYGAQSLNAAVTSLSALAIGIGGGFASMGTAYGGIDQLFAKSGDLATLIGNAFNGQADLAAIAKGFTDMQPLFDNLVKQLEKDSGGLDQLWTNLVTAWTEIGTFVENATQPAPVAPQNTYA